MLQRIGDLFQFKLDKCIILITVGVKVGENIMRFFRSIVLDKPLGDYVSLLKSRHSNQCQLTRGDSGHKRATVMTAAGPMIWISEGNRHPQSPGT
jgi:hypothetical protein